MASSQITPLTGARFAFIHALRGIAALLVVWSHLSGFWLLENGLTSAAQSVWQDWLVVPFHIFQNGGHLGVILFFLISGYIITHTSLRENRRAFAVKRIIRIFPPLAFATVIAWIFFQIAESTGTRLIGVTGGGIWHWTSALFLMDGFGLGTGRALDVTWTLVIELTFYVFVFILINSLRHNPLRSVWVMTGMWVGVFLIGNRFEIFSINGPLSVYVGFLILGQIIYFTHQGLIKVADGIIIGTLVGLLYILLIESIDPGFVFAPGGWRGVEPAASYALALLIFLAMMRLAPKVVVQPFRMLGDISYSLYLLHIPVGITTLNLLHLTGIPESINIGIAIGTSIFAAWVLYRCVELPSQKLARRILGAKPQNPASATTPST